MQKSNLIVFGIAPGVYNEIMEVPLILGHRPMDYMAIGMDALNKVPWPVQYIVTNHVEDLPTILSNRKMQGEHKAKIISPYAATGVDIVLDPPYEGPSGSSAIVGTLAAIYMGYTKIILCGIHLTGNAFEGNPYEAFRPGWIHHQKTVQGKVRSMGGWTRELLDAPTKKWMEELV